MPLIIPATVSSSGGGPTVLKQSANMSSNSNTVMSNIPGLAFTVETAILYHVFFLVKYTSTQAITTGIALGFTGPTMTSITWDTRAQNGADGANHEIRTINTLAGPLIVTGSKTLNADIFVRVEGLFLPSASGTVQLQARSEISASNVTTSNSVGFITRVG